MASKKKGTKRAKKPAGPRVRSLPAGTSAPGKAARAVVVQPGDRGFWAMPAGTDLNATAVSIGAAILSGCLWFLACADFDIWPFAWFAMLPALWIIERAPTRRRALSYGWLAGVVANVGGFYWIVGLLTRFAHLPWPLAVLGLLLLAFYQALVFLLFALVVRRVRQLSAERLGAPLPMALVAPVVMVAFELVVPFIFPWYLAITQAWITPVIQVAEFTGPLGVTFLLLLVNGALYDVATGAGRRRWLPAAVAGGVMAVVLVFGYVRMSQIDDRRAEAVPLTIGVVQGNIPFDEKGNENPNLAARQLQDLQLMSARLEDQGAELIVWSESSYPYFIPRYDIGTEQARDFAPNSRYRVRRGFDAPLIFGAITYRPEDPDDYPFNTALMLAEDGTYTARFDKIFLLMFGEYIPFLETFPSLRKILPRAAGHFARGQDIVTFPLEHQGQTWRLGPMICYEDILTDFNRKLAKHHPHLLVNITNDAWFGETSEPWEHLALSVYRSVELRTDMVRAVNTGVSAFVDANGRVYAKTYAVDPKVNPRGVDGMLEQVRLMEGGHTFYARFGDLFGWLCVLVTGFGWLVWPRLRRPAR
jgi:apolipoprotein N-acyltransferase